MDKFNEHIAKLCRKIVNGTGKPITFLFAVLFQVIWVIIGTITKLDPFPFVFLLTCSNIIQLCLIFVLAIGQQDTDKTQKESHKSIHEKLDSHKESHDLVHEKLDSIHSSLKNQ